MLKRHHGFSLIEVMIAMSICTFGLMVLLQLTWLGQQHADRSAALATQQILCRNRLNELVAGIRHCENVDKRVCEEDARFEYSIQTRQHPTLPLRLVEVVVVQAQPEFSASAQNRSRSASIKPSIDRIGREVRMVRFIAAGESQILSRPQSEELPEGSVSQ